MAIWPKLDLPGPLSSTTFGGFDNAMAEPLLKNTRPFLALYVSWHPSYADGPAMEEALRAHFRSHLYSNIAGGAGLSVLSRSVPAPGGPIPIPIDFDSAETTAIVALVDTNWSSDKHWRSYLKVLAEQTEQAGLKARLYLVAIDRVALDIGVEEEAIRWDKWRSLASPERLSRLIAELAYEFSRMLRHYLAHLEQPLTDEDELHRFLDPVKIFISHSKHDDHGERLAVAIRERLHSSQGLVSFFDVRDIPAGLRFHKVLLHEVRVSAMVAIHTDSYSTREWCRRELIEAKRHDVPLVVANSLIDRDERGFPYMGNVPIVRLDPAESGRIDVVIFRLLDEVLKSFLWRCRMQLAKGMADSRVVFVPRQPELLMLARVSAREVEAGPTLVYPDPPLSAEEERLFDEIAPGVQLRSMTEWLAGAVR